MSKRLNYDRKNKLKMVIRLAQPWNLFSLVEPPRSLVEPLNPSIKALH